MGLTRFLEHFRSPEAGRRRKVTLLGLVCARVCSAVSASVSQNELTWHQKTISAQHLCVMNVLKKVFECPLGTMQTTPPKACEPQTCHLHVPPTLHLHGPPVEGTHKRSCHQRRWLLTPIVSIPACRQNHAATKLLPMSKIQLLLTPQQLHCGAGKEVLSSHFRLFLLAFTCLRYQNASVQLCGGAQAATSEPGFEKSGLKTPQLFTKHMTAVWRGRAPPEVSLCELTASLLASDLLKACISSLKI